MKPFQLLVGLLSIVAGCASPTPDPGPVTWVEAADGGECVEGAWEAAAGAWEAVRGRAMREDCQDVWRDFLIEVNGAADSTPCTEDGESYNGCTVYSRRLMWITHPAVYRLIFWDVIVHEFLHVIVSCEGEPGNHEHETPDVWLPDPYSAEQIARDSDNGSCRGGL